MEKTGKILPTKKKRTFENQMANGDAGTSLGSFLRLLKMGANEKTENSTELRTQ